MGKSASLKVPEDETAALNLELMEEYNSFKGQQTAITNQLRLKKLKPKEHGCNSWEPFVLYGSKIEPCSFI